MFIRFQFYLPLVLKNSYFFFFTKFFQWLLFHFLDLCIIARIFSWTQLIFHLLRTLLSIRFSSYFIINNFMLFYKVFLFKKLYKFFHLFLNQLCDIGILCNDLDPNTQKVCNTFIKKFRWWTIRFHSHNHNVVNRN